MSRPLSQITIGSLFAGIGGLDLGLESCGLGPVLWQVEYDPFCRSILARHWPGAARAVHDVRLAGRSNLARVDLVCGGFPCQPVSLAGGRKAQEDERWLWPEYARIVGELRPRFVFLENVPGLLSAGDGAAFGEVLGSLAALGYAAEWDVFRASDVGAPHRRERWFLLAHADSGGCGPRGIAGVGGALGVGGEDPVHAAETQNAGAGDMAHAPRLAEREPADEAHAVAARGDARAVSGSERQPLADARASGRAARRLDVRTRQSDADGRGEGQSVGVGQADSNGARLEERERLPGDAGAERPPALRGDADAAAWAAQPCVGGVAHGLSAGLDGAAECSAVEAVAPHGDPGGDLRHALPDRWPAGRGEPQHPWEAPRTAHKVTARPARLKALGNAVIPAQAALAWRVLWARMQEQLARAA